MSAQEHDANLSASTTDLSCSICGIKFATTDRTVSVLTGRAHDTCLNATLAMSKWSKPVRNWDVAKW